MKYLLRHAHLVVDEHREFLDGALLIDDDTISDVFMHSDKVKIDEEYTDIDLGGLLVMPGFFDSHTHGILGMSFDSANRSEMDKIAYEFALDGTTTFLATLSYDLDPESFNSQLSFLSGYKSDTARFAGVHLEGPFLSKKHLGVGIPENFLDPDLKLVKQMCECADNIRQMTIAYELDGAKEVGSYLHEHDIRVMCGHSDAVLSDLDENVDGFTHLFNAMRGMHHRDITLVNCAFMNRYNFELIADGHHVERNVLDLLLRSVDRKRIMLVSDSSIGRKLTDGEYEFMSKKCYKNGTIFKTFDGHFAGSVVSINDEMKVLYELGAKYTDLLLYSGLNAYRFYNLADRRGTLQKGKYSDIVIMDDELNIRRVMVQGRFYDV